MNKHLPGVMIITLLFIKPPTPYFGKVFSFVFIEILSVRLQMNHAGCGRNQEVGSLMGSSFGKWTDACLQYLLVVPLFESRMRF